MERISLSQCKKQVSSYSTCTSNDMIRVPHTCLLLPGPSFILEGYFVLSAALSLITKWSHTFLSLYCMVVCRYTCRNTREYQLYFIDRLIQNLFIYQWHKSFKKKSDFFFPMDANCPPSSYPTCSPPQRLGPGRHFLLSVSNFAGNQDSTLRGRFLVLHVSL